MIKLLLFSYLKYSIMKKHNQETLCFHQQLRNADDGNARNLHSIGLKKTQRPEEEAGASQAASTLFKMHNSC